ncbi:MAG: S10 family serine carboxypeptidase-like protein, partial [Tepidisphaeraceae bacterium]
MSVPPILVVLALITSARAEVPATQPATTAASSKPADGDKLSVTRHQLALDGRALAYTATAGTMRMKAEDGKPKADVFFVAYELDDADARDVDARAARPVTFVFNGGPGAASVWLHLGTAGPQRVEFPADGSAPSPPYRLADNEATWLDATDLVFIDPVGTGYSRPAPGEKGEQFYGVKEDVASVADFVRLYTTRYGRWPSPKFLAGESYGTTRAAALSEHLLDTYGLSLNGIVLISSVLNFQTIQPAGANELPYPLFLPTYTA